MSRYEHLLRPLSVLRLLPVLRLLSMVPVRDLAKVYSTAQYSMVQYSTCSTGLYD